MFSLSGLLTCKTEPDWDVTDTFSDMDFGADTDTSNADPQSRPHTAEEAGSSHAHNNNNAENKAMDLRPLHCPVTYDNFLPLLC